MSSRALLVRLLLLFCFCPACGAGGGTVHAPVAPSDGSHQGQLAASSVRELPAACSSTWTPEQVASAGQAVLTCGSDVRRVDLDPGGPAVRAVLAGLDVARDRICACAAKMTAPPSVELTVHAHPAEGRATAALTEDEDVAAQDDTMRAFVECVGTTTATFPVVAPGQECPGNRATYDYPIGFPLGP